MEYAVTLIFFPLSISYRGEFYLRPSPLDRQELCPASIPVLLKGAKASSPLSRQGPCPATIPLLLNGDSLPQRQKALSYLCGWDYEPGRIRKKEREKRITDEVGPKKHRTNCRSRDSSLLLQQATPIPCCRRATQTGGSGNLESNNNLRFS